MAIIKIFNLNISKTIQDIQRVFGIFERKGNFSENTKNKK